MQLILNILILIFTIVLYFGLQAYLHNKLNKHLILLIWCAIFTIINIFKGALTLRIPIMGDYSFIVSILFAVILNIVYAYYFSYERCESKTDNLYYLLTKPLALELVINGLLLPIFCTFPVLLKGIAVSILIFNGASLLTSLLQVILGCIDEKKIGSPIGYIGLQFFICLFHALITMLTGSIWIPLILRIIYAGLFWKFRKFK